MNWSECQNYSRKVKPDFERSRSLRKIALKRIGCMAEISDLNFKFEANYSSLLEIFHSKAIELGYKIENHVCLGLFVKEVLGNLDAYRIFDDSRLKRNTLVYYGGEMTLKIAKDSISKIMNLIKSF